MKLIAAKGFRNNTKLKIPDPGHDHHIAKGTFFEVGGDKPADELSREEQQMLRQLNAAGVIADASDKKVVARIQREAEEEARVAERAERAANPVLRELAKESPAKDPKK